jgi:peptide/nickel transport system permease protein
MIGYLLRRLGLAFVTIWAISVICFVTIHLPPGDFADTYVEEMMASGSQGINIVGMGSCLGRIA